MGVLRMIYFASPHIV